MENTTLGMILAVLAAIFWGTGNTVARVGLQSVKATSATILALITGFIIAIAIALAFEFEALVSVSMVGIGWFALIGIFHFALGRLFLYQSMRYIGAARGTSVSHTSPLFALIFAVIFLAESLTIPLVIGTLSIVCGVYTLLSESSETAAIKRSRMIGYAFGLGAAVCWGAIAVLIKHASQYSSPFVVLSFALLSGLIVLSIGTGKGFEIRLKTNRKAIILLLAAGLLNGIGLVSFYSAVPMAPVVVISPLVATSPLFTILCVRLFLRRLERLTLHVLIGSLLVVTGGVLVAIY